MFQHWTRRVTAFKNSHIVKAQLGFVSLSVLGVNVLGFGPCVLLTIPIIYSPLCMTAHLSHLLTTVQPSTLPTPPRGENAALESASRVRVYL